MNKPLDGLEVGQYWKDISIPENGQWVYQENKPELKLGDKIYYWIFVVKNGQSSIQEGFWTVTGENFFEDLQSLVIDTKMFDYNPYIRLQ